MISHGVTYTFELLQFRYFIKPAVIDINNMFFPAVDLATDTSNLVLWYKYALISSNNSNDSADSGGENPFLSS